MNIVFFIFLISTLVGLAYNYVILKKIIDMRLPGDNILGILGIYLLTLIVIYLAGVVFTGSFL